MIRDTHPTDHKRMVAQHKASIRALFPHYTAEQALDEAMNGGHVLSISDAWLEYAIELEAL